MSELAITGTREAINAKQGYALFDLLRKMRQRLLWLNHGDCVGVDELTARYWAIIGGKLRAHDPDNPALRAFVESDEREAPLPYLDRNKAMVDRCRALIGVPIGAEVQRPGTWSTVRYARRLGRPIAIIMPDGVVIKEG